MYSLLSQTGLYNLKNSKYVKAEIESYLTAIEFIKSQIDSLLKYTFVQLADSIADSSSLVVIPSYVL